MTKTLIVVLTITPGTPSRVKAAITWPVGDTQRHDLNHDWSADSWDWRNGRMPTSLVTLLRSWGLMLHGERQTYVSPANVGTESNEQTRVSVYEIDYDG